MRPEPVAPRGLVQCGAGHRGADAAAAGPRVYHQLGHRGIRVPWGAQIEVAGDFVVASRIGDQQVRGAFLPEFAQYLLADGRYPVEFGCRSDEFTYLPLLFGGQCGAPDRQRH